MRRLDGFHQILNRSKIVTTYLAGQLRRVLALGLLMSILVPVPTAPAASLPPSLPEIPDSAQLRSQDLVRGTALDQGGRPANGATVVLMLWPSTDVQRSLQVGDSVRRVPVAKATTDARGAFVLRLDKVERVTPGVGSDGLVDLEVVAEHDGQFSSFSFSRRVVMRGGALRLEPVDSTSGSDRSLPEQALMRMQAGGDNGANDINATTAEDAPSVQKSCDAPRLVQDLGDRRTLIGVIFSTTSNVDSSFLFGVGSTSTLGVGYSVSGSYGSWSASGTLSRSTNATTSVALSGVGSRYIDTDFRYGKYAVWCFVPEIGYGSTPDYYLVRPMYQTGGVNYRYPSVPGTSVCKPYPKGTGLNLNYSTAITWSNGVAISAVIGINLSSRTGYTTSAEASWRFTRGPGQLCSRNSQGPTTNPGYNVARP